MIGKKLYQYKTPDLISPQYSVQNSQIIPIENFSQNHEGKGSSITNLNFEKKAYLTGNYFTRFHELVSLKGNSTETNLNLNSKNYLKTIPNKFLITNTDFETEKRRSLSLHTSTNNKGKNLSEKLSPKCNYITRNEYEYITQPSKFGIGKNYNQSNKNQLTKEHPKFFSILYSNFHDIPNTKKPAKIVLSKFRGWIPGPGTKTDIFSIRKKCSEYKYGIVDKNIYPKNILKLPIAFPESTKPISRIITDMSAFKEHTKPIEKRKFYQNYYYKRLSENLASPVWTEGRILDWIDNSNNKNKMIKWTKKL